jgi:hypothetical protein
MNPAFFMPGTTTTQRALLSRSWGIPFQRFTLTYGLTDIRHARYRNAKARASQMEHQGKLSASDKKKIDAKADKVLAK